MRLEAAHVIEMANEKSEACARITGLSAEKDRLEASMRIAELGRVEVERNLVSLQGDLEATREQAAMAGQLAFDKVGLERLLCELEPEVEDLRLRVGWAEERQRELERRLWEREEQLGRSEVEVARLKGEREGLMGRLARQMTLENDISEQWGRLEAAEGEKERLEKRLEEASKEAEALRRARCEAEERAGGGEKAREEAERVREGEMEEAVATLRGERDALAASLAEVRREGDALAASLAGARRERDALSASLSAASSERDALLSGAKSAWEGAGDIARMKGELEKVVSEHRIMRMEIGLLGLGGTRVPARGGRGRKRWWGEWFFAPCFGGGGCDDARQAGEYT